MNELLNRPTVSQEGVSFTVTVDFIRRDCLITIEALHKLCAVKREDPDEDIMKIFNAFEAKINGVARRLVAAGVAGSPLTLHPETFSVQRAQ